MTGSEVERLPGVVCPPREPCTVPLLDGDHDVFMLDGHDDVAVDVGEMSSRDNRPMFTIPLMATSASQSRLQDVLLRDRYAITPPLDLSLGRLTPIGTPIPSRVHGIHTPLSGVSTSILDCNYGKSISVDSVSLILPGPASMFDTKSQLSMLSDTSAMLPFCRICHVIGDGCDILISPCRCAGTLQFIHNSCLMRWLEITTKKSRKPPRCELCHYQYHRHKKFKFDHWRFPRVSRQDKVLHIIFLLNLIVMVGCAIATVMCFLSDKDQINNFPRNKVELSTEEVITLSCGVLFFVSFFVAMSVQIKAKHTVYQLFVKFIMQNMQWEIEEYDKSKDSLYMVKQCPKQTPAFV